ncbi:DNA internalization-related competence protein ComEC/Rec2 [Motilimonas eburnea]|uniref:DNA internalization-related competence protein ComEC/Rec2 n=1 Tax=Motilimonas eburnea TaxID=1737488 RepID=UPI001E3F3D45|nr:DNA internalization-related competence protein ComEC/Rec2 [Motilimonas eburnea]MCE2572504.1 DNA internalization-related competence protein ComEC/Rec2 [Motilimonas eburnea]
MRKGYVCLVTGIASGLFLPYLLSLHLCILGSIFASLLCCFKRTRFLSYFFVGLVWFSCYAHWQLNWLPASFTSGQEHTIVVQINSLNSHRNSHIYQASLISIDDYAPIVSKKVKLTWFRSEQRLLSGQIVTVSAKIKPIWGRGNTVGVNQRAYLFSQHIGYQVDIKRLISMDNKSPSWRVSWHETVKRYTEPLTHQGMLLALVFADKSSLDWPLRQKFQQMGLAHILVISGLHIMLVGSSVTALAWSVFSVFNHLTGLRWHTLRLASLIGLVAAIIYAWLAGFTVPTQRALIMYGVVVMTLFLQRKINPLDGILLAMVLVALWDPLAVLGIGFWLSFAAVVSIVIIARFVPRSPVVGLRWLTYILLFQVGLWLLMMPLQISQFSGVSLLSAVNNVLFVPLMSVVVIPACLLTALLILLFGPWVAPGLVLMEWLLNVMVNLVFYWPSAWITVTAGQAYWLFILTVGCWLSWQYHHSLFRCGKVTALMAVAFVIIIWQGEKASVPWQVVIFDVGQGLSVLVESEGEWLLYDTGFATDTGFSIAKSVIMPFLNRQQVKQLHHFVVSHQDNDHAGGAQDIFRSVNVKQAWHNQGGGVYHYCRRHQEIELGAFTGRFLSQNSSEVGKRRNNTSCVLRLETTGFSLLLPGDIEAKAEAALISQAEQRKWLKSDVLLVPHHGSHTSSTLDFITWVAPIYAIVSAGRYNPWQHPDERVVARYQQLKVKLYNTATDGMIMIQPTESGISVKRYRHDFAPYWFNRALLPFAP